MLLLLNILFRQTLFYLNNFRKSYFLNKLPTISDILEILSSPATQTTPHYMKHDLRNTCHANCCSFVLYESENAAWELDLFWIPTYLPV